MAHDSRSWFTLAMAQWRNSQKEEARRWFDKGADGARAASPEDAELRQLWAEAAKLLGRPGPAANSAPAAAGEAAR